MKKEVVAKKKKAGGAKMLQTIREFDEDGKRHMPAHDDAHEEAAAKAHDPEKTKKGVHFREHDSHHSFGQKHGSHSGEGFVMKEVHAIEKSMHDMEKNAEKTLHALEVGAMSYSKAEVEFMQREWHSAHAALAEDFKVAEEKFHYWEQVTAEIFARGASFLWPHATIGELELIIYSLEMKARATMFIVLPLLLGSVVVGLSEQWSWSRSLYWSVVTVRMREMLTETESVDDKYLSWSWSVRKLVILGC